MVAGDSKRIIVIKNIASNLIEEAILILKPGQEAPAEAGGSNPVRDRTNTRNDLLLSEAEFIIDQYIREHGLLKSRSRRLPPKKSIRLDIPVNTAINFFLASAVIFLLFVIGKYFLF